MESVMFDYKDYYDKIAEELPTNSRICEIGSGDGHSAIYLAKKLYELSKGFKLYMVDNLAYGQYLQMKTIYENIIKSGLGELIEFIPMDSISASKLFNDEYLNFIFLDSSHEYNETKDSIKAWFPKLVNGGIFSGHDFYEYESVKKAVIETVPEKITRDPLDETIFKEENVLHVIDTSKGYGIWRFKKRWYLKLKLMFNWRSLHTAYINLSHRADRRERMEAELSRVGLNAARFEAIKTTDDSWNREPYKVMFKRSKGAIGCMISQMSVMAEAYSKGVGAMVLEDDLVICSDIKERLDYIQNFVNEKEPEFDIIFLGGTVHINPAWWHIKPHYFLLDKLCNCNLKRDADRIDDERMIRVYGMFSTHAYIVRHESIPKILNLLHSVMRQSIGIDFSLIIHQPNLRCFAFMPGCIKQYNNQSDIGNGITYFENFASLGTHWWADRMEQFNPSTYNWAEADKMNRIEESLNGCYNSLFGEVAESDCYKLKEIKFIPDVIFDIGANVGVFSRFARTLFPNAKIISVEPHPENIFVFKKFTNDKNLVLIEKAIGNGVAYHGLTSANGSGETYLSIGLGYSDEEEMKNDSALEASAVETISLSEVINLYSTEGQKILLKIDCEGAENFIWQHKASMEVLKKADYLAMELHWYGHNGKEWQMVQDETKKAIKSLEETHNCELDNTSFWATKK